MHTHTHTHTQEDRLKHSLYYEHHQGVWGPGEIRSQMHLNLYISLILYSDNLLVSRGQAHPQQYNNHSDVQHMLHTQEYLYAQTVA